MHKNYIDFNIYQNSYSNLMLIKIQIIFFQINCNIYSLPKNSKIFFYQLFPNDKSIVKSDLLEVISKFQ